MHLEILSLFSRGDIRERTTFASGDLVKTEKSIEWVPLVMYV